MPTNLRIHFQKPETHLAVKISAIVLAILLAAVFLSAAIAYQGDEKRKLRIFQTREAVLLQRPAAIEMLTRQSRNDLSNRMFERRGPLGEFRNLIVVFPDGTLETLGMLDRTQPAVSVVEGLPLRKLEIRTVWSERFSFYAFPSGNRTIVFYEPSSLLEGPRKETFASLLFGVSLFSMLLFFVALRISRSVIRPIEELAERERAYARHIAHELKTPLAVIRSELELVRAIPEEGEGRIASALEEADAMRSSIDDLLLLAVSEGGISKRSVDLSDALASELAKNAEGDTVSWKIVPTEGGVRIDAEPRLLKAYLRNVLANVRAHALSGTDAEIRLSETEFSVSNRCQPIPKSVCDRAFDPFVGTPWKGSGIGLSLVKRIADLHGWKVSFSEKDGIATLKTEFPNIE